QRDVGVVLEHRRHHEVPGADLGDDLEVGLEVQESGERAAHQGLVVGEEKSDGGGHDRTTEREKPGESRRGTTVAPTSAARSRSPARPEPWPLGDGVAAPLSMTSAHVAVSRTSQWEAPEWRITLVTPSRTVQANSSRRSDGTSSVELGSSASISAARSAT